MKPVLHRVAIWLENLFERVIPASRKPPLIEPYLGYATATHMVVRGRVLTGLRRTQSDVQRSRFINFVQMVGLFLTREVADVPVRVIAQDHRTLSDEEGYFTLELLRQGRGAGWHDIGLDIPEQVDSSVLAQVLIPSVDAEFGVISDIDDTVMKTGAYSLWRNLWTSLTGSTLSRTVFPDAVDLMARLHGGRNPVYYVSSSPWNLHAFLKTVLFERAGLVRGPLFLRDLGISPDQFISGTHGDHKGAQLDLLLGGHPALCFILIGDSGQHDAQVYRDAVQRWPGRIKMVILRDVDPKPAAAVTAALDDIRAAGVPVWRGQDYAGVSLPAKR